MAGFSAAPWDVVHCSKQHLVFVSRSPERGTGCIHVNPTTPLSKSKSISSLDIDIDFRLAGRCGKHRILNPIWISIFPLGRERARDGCVRFLSWTGLTLDHDFDEDVYDEGVYIDQHGSPSPFPNHRSGPHQGDPLTIPSRFHVLPSSHPMAVGGPTDASWPADSAVRLPWRRRASECVHAQASIFQKDARTFSCQQHVGADRRLRE